MKIYLVGGAVRDTLLGMEPKDRDYVVTGSSPEEMLALGYDQVGASFPVFLHPETREEYALARTERKNGVGYHGFDVSFSPNTTIEADLARRDLTINSMAIDQDTGEIIDPYGGVKDLHDKVLRHTSEAFRDDPLRVIRLARFAARYSDFMIAPQTILLARDVVASGELDHLPPERHLAELVKMFSDSTPRPQRFFSVLTVVHAYNSTFYGELVDVVLPFIMTTMAQQHDFASMNAGERVEVALVAAASPVINKFPVLFSSTARTVKTAVDGLLANTGELAPSEVHALLERLRAWAPQHPTFHFFMKVWEARERAFGVLRVSVDELHKAQQCADHICASHFPALEGKALGEAIRAERSYLITRALLT